MTTTRQWYIANRLKNDYILCPDMRQRSIAGCYQNNVAWLYKSTIAFLVEENKWLKKQVKKLTGIHD
ncbi:hypothetical protein [Symbiopectobacterium purcellii]|uniref:hypothetical protein n=1 Tax=Symbiopectobacterium purcellii TaxID=2871826 RepID=UPI003F8443E2